MCQEIWIDSKEATRLNDCWCPLTEGYDELERKKTLQELGEKVWKALQAKQTVNPDLGEVDISIALRRW